MATRDWKFIKLLDQVLMIETGSAMIEPILNRLLDARIAAVIRAAYYSEKKTLYASGFLEIAFEALDLLFPGQAIHTQ